ncbi:MAG: hypothetical protein ACYTBS_04270 [Planctomycetota bacterium]|jgi:hypothetical protein
MDLGQVKARIGELLVQLETSIGVMKTLGAPEEKIELLEDMEYFLQNLLKNIQVLESEESLAVLEAELRDTNLNLQGLRETLLLWEPPDEDLIAEVDASQTEVLKLLGKVKSGRGVKKKAPVLLIGTVVAFAAFRALRK